jgi:YHS domain-containing protein
MLLRAVLEIVFILLAARAVWRLLAGILQGVSQPPRPTRPRSSDQAVQMVRDPVCGTFLLPDHAVAIADGTRRLYFCSTACRDKYRSRTA